MDSNPAGPTQLSPKDAPGSFTGPDQGQPQKSWSKTSFTTCARDHDPSISSVQSSHDHPDRQCPINRRAHDPVTGRPFKAMEEKIANYKRLRELTEQWVDVALALESAEREATKRAR